MANADLTAVRGELAAAQAEAEQLRAEVGVMRREAGVRNAAADELQREVAAGRSIEEALRGQLAQAERLRDDAARESRDTTEALSAARAEAARLQAAVVVVVPQKRHRWTEAA